ncbi:hypothetical protein DL767_003069 [Monosporascus sp. MG133]|nr:hypothetical protein DL767_003069 [Monosporascus sp. MG133]
MSPSDATESSERLMGTLPPGDGLAASKSGIELMSRPHTRVLYLACFLSALLDFTTFINMAPQTDIIERILLALPYGVMADHRGRKTVFLLFMLGLFISDIWVKLVSDVVPAQERVRALLKLTAMDLVAQIVATPIAAAMMRYSSWYPLALSSALLVFIALLGLRLPETRPHRYRPLPGEDLEEENPGQYHRIGRRPLLKEYEKFFESLKSTLTRPVIMLLFVFFLACFGAQALQLLLQYASKKFGWGYGKASLLMSLRSSFHLALATILMPLIDTWISRRWGVPADQKDMTLSQFSGVLLVLGHLTLFLANGPPALCFGLVTTALGSSFLVTLRSTMTALVPASSEVQVNVGDQG